MKLILCGAGIMLGGLVLLLAMVARAIEPGLALAFIGYAAAFSGMLVGVAGAVDLPRRRPARHPGGRRGMFDDGRGELR